MVSARKSENAGCVLVVDDEVEVLAAVERSLRRRGFEVHTAATAAEVRSAVEALGDRLDVVLLDWILAGRTAEFLADHLHQERVHASLVIFTAHDPVSIAAAARGLRADGFVQKSDPLAIRGAVSKAAWRARERREWPSRLEQPRFLDGEEFLDWKAGEICNRAGRRDPKDRDILRLRIVGVSTRDVAKRVGLSEGAVKKRVHNIVTKLGAQNVADFDRVLVDHLNGV